MALIVLDASVVVALYMDEHSSQDAQLAISAAAEAQAELHAPELLMVEVANALRSGVLGGRLSQKDAVVALHDLVSLETLTVHPMRNAIGHTLALALEHGLTAYDAAYLALAAKLGGIILTGDEMLLSEPPKIGIKAVSPSGLTPDAFF